MQRNIRLGNIFSACKRSQRAVQVEVNLNMCQEGAYSVSLFSTRRHSLHKCCVLCKQKHTACAVILFRITLAKNKYNI
jgi:hypothetical protein